MSNPAVPENKNLANFVMTQITPLVFDTQVAVVVRYYAAVGVNWASATSAGFEGYLLGRLAIAALERVRGFNYTSDRFLDAIYKNHYFALDDLDVGPFYQSVNATGCNQGLHSVYRFTIDPDLGIVNRQSVISFPSTCGYKSKEWVRITFGMSCSFARAAAATTTTSQSMNCESFYQGVSAAFKKVNDAGGVRGTTELYVTQLDDRANAVQTVANVHRLTDASIFGLIGLGTLGVEQAAMLATQHGKVLVGAQAGNLNIRVPFQRHVLNFRASTAGELFAITHFCYCKKRFRNLALVHEANDFGVETREYFAGALEEKRLTIYAEAAYNDSRTVGVAVQDVIEKASDMQALVFTGSDQVLGECR